MIRTILCCGLLSFIVVIGIARLATAIIEMDDDLRAPAEHTSIFLLPLPDGTVLEEFWVGNDAPLTVLDTWLKRNPGVEILDIDLYSDMATGQHVIVRCRQNTKGEVTQ